MKWPNTIPEDLRKRMDDTLSRRCVDSATLWEDVVDWLNTHGVQPPDHPLPEMEELPKNLGH